MFSWKYHHEQQCLGEYLCSNKYIINKSRQFLGKSKYGPSYIPNTNKIIIIFENKPSSITLVFKLL